MGEDWEPGFKDWEGERKQDLGGLVSRPVHFPSPVTSSGEVPHGEMWKQIHVDTEGSKMHLILRSFLEERSFKLRN